MFLSTIKEWNNLDLEIKKSKSIGISKINIWKFTRPKPNSVYYCHNPNRVRLITRFRLRLNHFRELKLKLFISAVMILKHLLTTYFLPMSMNEWLDKIKRIICGILELSDAVTTKILLFGDNFLGASSNNLTLNPAINSSCLPKDLMTRIFDSPKEVPNFNDWNL